MAIKEFRRPSDDGEWKVAEVADALRDKGYLFGPQGFGSTVEIAEDGTRTQVIQFDIDPHIDDAVFAKDVAAFTPEPDPVLDAQRYLRGRAKEIATRQPIRAPGKDAVTAQAETAGATEHDLLALLVVLGMVEG